MGFQIPRKKIPDSKNPIDEKSPIPGIGFFGYFNRDFGDPKSPIPKKFPWIFRSSPKRKIGIGDPQK